MQWQSMQTGVEYNANGMEVDYKSKTMDSAWSWLSAEIQTMILDMAYRNDHRTRMKQVCKEIVTLYADILLNVLTRLEYGI